MTSSSFLTGGSYRNSERCTLRPIANAPLEVRSFDTESGFDFLTVNGNRFSGNARYPSSCQFSAESCDRPLDGMVPTREITWCVCSCHARAHARHGQRRRRADPRSIWYLNVLAPPAPLASHSSHCPFALALPQARTAAPRDEGEVCQNSVAPNRLPLPPPPPSPPSPPPALEPPPSPPPPPRRPGRGTSAACASTRRSRRRSVLPDAPGFQQVVGMQMLDTRVYTTAECHHARRRRGTKYFAISTEPPHTPPTETTGRRRRTATSTAPAVAAVVVVASSAGVGCDAPAGGTRPPSPCQAGVLALRPVRGRRLLWRRHHAARLLL